MVDNGETPQMDSRIGQTGKAMRSFAVTALSFLFASVALADSLPQIHVPQIKDGQILAGGMPKAEAWQGAPLILLTNYWSASGAVQERTEVRLLHSRTHLFVSFVCEDSEIVARRTDRDDHTFRDDCVEVFLAAPLEGKLLESVNVEVSASGAWADVLFRMPNWINYDWNPSDIKVEVTRTEIGWNAQIALAFSELPLIRRTNGYRTLADSEQADFERADSLLSVPVPKRLRANFSRWHRPQGQLSIWSNPNTPVPHPLVLDYFGWLIFEGD